MVPDTALSLGDFWFARAEIPEKIPFGGDQMLVTHKLVGGKRIIDAMGRDDRPIEWSGIFTGETATERALYLDGLRIAGAPLVLAWDEFILSVIINSFQPDFERYYQIPYRISCTVVEDLGSPVTYIADPGIDYLIYDDLNSAWGFGNILGDGVLSDLLSSLDSAIRQVSSFATAVQSTINGVLGPLAAVQARVRLLIASTANTLSNVTTLGGILPNNPISTQAAKLNSQIVAMTQAPQLYNLQSVLGRMGGNLGSIGSGNRTVTMAGGNLYGVAAQQYGDATAWTSIARANGLTDPQLTGINSISIPSNPDTGGVMNA